MQTPVIITKTEGFWKKDDFSHLENIYFIKDNNLNEWSEAINSMFEDSSLHKHIATNAHKLVLNKFDVNMFNKNCLNLNKKMKISIITTMTNPEERRILGKKL